MLLTIGTAGLDDEPLTVDDLQDTQDDGRRYELADGGLTRLPHPPVSTHSSQADSSPV